MTLLTSHFPSNPSSSFLFSLAVSGRNIFEWHIKGFPSRFFETEKSCSFALRPCTHYPEKSHVKWEHDGRNVSRLSNTRSPAHFGRNKNYLNFFYCFVTQQEARFFSPNFGEREKVIPQIGAYCTFFFFWRRGKTGFLIGAYVGKRVVAGATEDE